MPKSLKYRLGSVFVMFSLLFSGMGVASASENGWEENVVVTEGGNSVPTAPMQGGAETRGIKTFITKKALKGVAWMVRETPEFILEQASDTLDDKARRALLKNNHKIADEIDEVAELADLSHHVVKEKLTYALEPIVGQENALMIADVLAWLAL